MLGLDKVDHESHAIIACAKPWLPSFFFGRERIAWENLAGTQVVIGPDRKVPRLRVDMVKNLLQDFLQGGR